MLFPLFIQLSIHWQNIHPWKWTFLWAGNNANSIISNHSFQSEIQTKFLFPCYNQNFCMNYESLKANDLLLRSQKWNTEVGCAYTNWRVNHDHLQDCATLGFSQTIIRYHYCTPLWNNLANFIVVDRQKDWKWVLWRGHLQ